MRFGLFSAAILFSAGAVAAEAVLVHDIAPPHPRYTQLTQMAADVARRTQGMLAIAINPGGKVLYPGQASLDAVRAAVTGKWAEMQADDARLVADLVAGGARQSIVPAGALAPWKSRTEGVTRAFEAAHPEIMQRFRALAGAP